MTEKFLINSIEECVDESLRGFSKLNLNLFVDFEKKMVFDAKCCEEGKVAIISGGGSGHEPFPAGYVGEGMLTASVSGQIFTSPPSKHILHSIRLVSTRSSGVLLLVPNYTGDVLNFGLAAETALGEGITVESVIVGEDVAQVVGGAKVGKRGMCGLVLALKIAGFLARTGYNLSAVKSLTTEAVRNLASMSLCVSACSKPGVGQLFHLEKDELEVGVGVHGEAGVARVKMMSARQTVEKLLQFILHSLNATEGNEVVALVNNLGSLSYLELWLLTGELENQLLRRKIKLLRFYAGCFFTSLNMVGVQICILKLNQNTRNLFLEALDHPTTASAWANKINPSVNSGNMTVAPAKITKIHSNTLRLTPKAAEVFKRCFVKISEELRKHETYLNYLDSTCGDGDCGTTIAGLATLMKTSADESDFSNPIDLLSDLNLAIGESVGGTTGALYGLFIKGVAGELENYNNLNSGVAFSKCWRAGVESIKKYSTARIGDRTMLDSLETGCQIFESQLELEKPPKQAFRSAVEAAAKGHESTKFMKALAGRASYVDQSQQKDFDAGAYAVTVWLSAIQSVLNEK